MQEIIEKIVAKVGEEIGEEVLEAMGISEETAEKIMPEAIKWLMAFLDEDAEGEPLERLAEADPSELTTATGIEEAQAREVLNLLLPHVQKAKDEGLTGVLGSMLDKDGDGEVEASDLLDAAKSLF